MVWCLKEKIKQSNPTQPKKSQALYNMIKHVRLLMIKHNDTENELSLTIMCEHRIRYYISVDDKHQISHTRKI